MKWIAEAFIINYLNLQGKSTMEHTGFSCENKSHSHKFQKAAGWVMLQVKKEHY